MATAPTDSPSRRRADASADSAIARINDAAFGFQAYRSRDIAVETSRTFLVVSRFHRAIGVITIIASAVFLLCIMLLKVDERRRDVAALRLMGISAAVDRSVGDGRGGGRRGAGKRRWRGDGLGVGADHQLALPRRVSNAARVRARHAGHRRVRGGALAGARAWSPGSSPRNVSCAVPPLELLSGRHEERRTRARARPDAAPPRVGHADAASQPHAAGDPRRRGLGGDAARHGDAVERHARVVPRVCCCRADFSCVSRRRARCRSTPTRRLPTSSAITRTLARDARRADREPGARRTAARRNRRSHDHGRGARRRSGGAGRLRDHSSGRAPTGANELVASDDFLRATGAKIGDTLSAAAGYDPQLRAYSGRRTLTIVGRAHFLYMPAEQRAVALPLRDAASDAGPDRGGPRVALHGARARRARTSTRCCIASSARCRACRRSPRRRRCARSTSGSATSGSSRSFSAR